MTLSDAREQVAYILLARALPGARIVEHDDGSENGMFDAWIVWPTEEREAVEVTTVLDTLINQNGMTVEDRSIEECIAKSERDGSPSQLPAPSIAPTNEAFATFLKETVIPGRMSDFDKLARSGASRQHLFLFFVGQKGVSFTEVFHQTTFHPPMDHVPDSCTDIWISGQFGMLAHWNRRSGWETLEVGCPSEEEQGTLAAVRDRSNSKKQSHQTG